MAAARHEPPKHPPSLANLSPASLGRSLPIAEIIVLQLDEVPFRVLVVQRHGDTVIERESRDDALVPHPGVGRHQVGKAFVFERAVVHRVVLDLVRVIFEARH